MEEYHLGDVSGKSVIKHHETHRIIRDIQSGYIEALIFSKISRLARNVKKLFEFLYYFQKHNTDLTSLGESINTNCFSISLSQL